MIKKLLNRIAHIKKYMKENEQVLLLHGEEIDTVKGALEKQITQNAVKDGTIYKCPVCNARLGRFDKYCSQCGQAVRME